ncbi:MULTISPECIES: Fic family protein [Pseudomonas]|uniref:protein adenylyltransferase n=1 Tax=Pseudomonas gingeri TaxID=117681 RepID=A0A7Y7WAU4_9PSED|nr:MULTISPECIES: Fic family protein [unclassified Pseudomonas]MCU1739119.1 Fic family protein [Pseudomonas sp. 20S_6.2_Bac1]NWB45955.1 Fic family protein [Pseudomonas gingeri]
MSFDPFGDFETAGYLRNEYQLKDPYLVKRVEHAAFESNVEDALSFLTGLEDVDYDAVLRVHEILFSSFYPWAGKDRNEVAPTLRVTKGDRNDADSTEFAYPDEVRRATELAIRQAAKHSRFKERPGEVMGLLAFAHPFLDGNGRTILLVYMELCFRAGFAIDWSQTTKDDYLRVLSAEIREPNERHLDTYLQPHVVEVARREDWPAIIGEIKGLDGLDKEGITYENLDGSMARPYSHYRSYLAQPLEDSETSRS